MTNHTTRLEAPPPRSKTSLVYLPYHNIPRSQGRSGGLCGVEKSHVLSRVEKVNFC